MGKSVAPAAEKAPSQRRVVLMAVLTLLWTVKFYCANGDSDLFWLTAAAAVVAWLLPRPLPLTSRWIIWLSLGLAVISLASNIERIGPSKGDYLQLYLLDRVVTVVFAASALSAVFFRLDRAGLTRLWCGVLPMAMLCVGRNGTLSAPDAFISGYYLYGVLAMLAGTELMRQDRRQRDSGNPLSGRERAGRGFWMMLAAVLALSTAPLVEEGVMVVQRQLMGLMYGKYHQRDWRGDSELVLSRGLPYNFRGRNRLLLTMKSPYAPGYLRENVFTVYEHGRWKKPEPGIKIYSTGIATNALAGDLPSFPLTPDSGDLVVNIDVLAPKMLQAVCLPGNAVELYADIDTLMGAIDGMIVSDEEPLLRYNLALSTNVAAGPAYPLPLEPSHDIYLGYPSHLAGNIADWVAECDGLREAATAREAAEAIAHDLATRYTYDEHIRIAPSPDPLITFMKTRTGFCTHFATAAAILLRASGFPARVVGGYAANEYAPWLRRWTVREHHGHAWVEVWAEDERRWLLLEATPNVGHQFSTYKIGYLRRAHDFIVMGWKSLRQVIEEADPLQLVADAGAGLIIWLGRVLWSGWGVGLAALGAVWLAWRRMRMAQESDKEKTLRLLSETARKISIKIGGDCRRQSWESWDDWLGRLGEKVESAEKMELVKELFEEYQEIRYRRELDLAAARAWMENARALGKLIPKLE